MKIDNSNVISKLVALDNITCLGLDDDDLLSIEYTRLALLHKLIIYSANDSFINVISNCGEGFVEQCADELSHLFSDHLIQPLIDDYNNNYSLNIGDVVTLKMVHEHSNVTKLNNFNNVRGELMKAFEQHSTIIIKEKPIIVNNEMIKIKESLKAFSDSLKPSQGIGHSRLMKFMNSVANLAKVSKEVFEVESRAFTLTFEDKNIRAMYGKQLEEYDFTENELLWVEKEKEYYNSVITTVNATIDKFCNEISKWFESNQEQFKNRTLAQIWMREFKVDTIAKCAAYSFNMTLGQALDSYSKEYDGAFYNIKNTTDALIKMHKINS